MKSPLKYLLVALGAALLSLPVIRAEDGPGGPPPKGERRGKLEERLAEELGLSADQKAQMKELRKQEKSELDALRDDASIAKEDKRAKLGAIRKAYQDKRQALLTPEQREKADKLRENFEKHREGREERREKPDDKP